MVKQQIELGCGLIGIGRTWGIHETPIPTEQEVIVFLGAALRSGITYFDTAPSYGNSEERFGKWLESLTTEERKNLTIATKFGEHWSSTSNEPYVDHSYSALVRSLDQSINRLGVVDILQLHKTTPEVLRSKDLERSLRYAEGMGVKRFGASVSDQESGELVCDDGRFDVIQLPFNMQNHSFFAVIQKAILAGKTVVTNRPFNMGETVAKKSRNERVELERKAFEFILGQHFTGVILTGTKSIPHLRENIAAFQAAQATSSQ